MISKTKINQHIKNKTNKYLVETLMLAKKNSGWLEVARILSGPSRKRISINLEKLNQNSKEGETLVVPGRVLGVGVLDKKIRVCAVGFSETAVEKIKEKKGEIVYLAEEIKKNPKAQGIKLIK